jgi:hypothetical protein
MLKGIRTSLFGMAVVTKIVHRISPYHRLDVRRTHRVVTTRALQRLSGNPCFFHRMMRLFIELSSHVSVTAKAEVRLLGLKQIFFLHGRMDGMAMVTRDLGCLMLALVPEGQAP